MSLINENEIIQFGKFKGKQIRDIIINEPNYSKWCLSQPFIESYPEIKQILDNEFKDKNEHFLNFGKYRNKSLAWIRENDIKYIDYLKKNEYVKSKMEDLWNSL